MYLKLTTIGEASIHLPVSTVHLMTRSFVNILLKVADVSNLVSERGTPIGTLFVDLL